MGNYAYHASLLRRKNKIVIRDSGGLKSKIILCHQSTPNEGHSGRDLTAKRVKQLFYWKGITANIRQFVQNCQIAIKLI